MADSSTSQEDIFYDALAEKEPVQNCDLIADPSPASEQVGARDPTVEYFELEKEDDVAALLADDDSGDHHHHQVCEEEVNNKGKKVKVSKQSSFRKLNDLVKSKVDALGKSKMFGGKKKGEKQDKGVKKEETTTPETKKKGAKGKESQESQPESSTKLPVGISHEKSPSGARHSPDKVTSSANSGATRPVSDTKQSPDKAVSGATGPVSGTRHNPDKAPSDSARPISDVSPDAKNVAGDVSSDSNRTVGDVSLGEEKADKDILDCGTNIVSSATQGLEKPASDLIYDIAVAVGETVSSPTAGDTQPGGSTTGGKSPTTYASIWSENSSPQVEGTDMVYTLAQPVPVEPSHSATVSSEAGGPDEVGTYDLAQCLSHENSPRPLSEGVDSEAGSQSRKQDNKSLYYMSAQVPDMRSVSPHRDTDSLNTVYSMLSVNRGCQEGMGAAVPIDFLNPQPSHSKEEEEASEYNKLYFKSTKGKLSAARKQRLKDRGYDTLASIGSRVSQDSLEMFSEDLGGQDTDSDINPSEEDEEDLSFDWGSEFDEISYQDSVDDGLNKDEAPDKPLPPIPGKGKGNILRAGKSISPDPQDPGSSICLPVMINPEKHPPPVLPPLPEGLTEKQKKRRLIVDQIIGSERSYLESLERLVKDYERPVMEFIPHAKSPLKPVFAEMREIISHHKMFQIELAETAKLWDKEEKIGDIFTASFSKTMLVNAYSIYVNNFAAAMEDIRSLQRSNRAFEEFLNKQGRLSFDRLTIFGLMVKPVQRFPQFIMFLQDLIKYTPQDHHDRRALQLAMTELENVAYKLNERKRQSEQKFQAHQTVQQMIRQKVQHMLTTWNLEVDTKRRLIRGDEVEQVYGEFGSMKCKERRLILMNDLVLCVKVLQKEQAGFSVERLALRWIAKLKDLELKDTAVTPSMQSIITKDTGKIHIMSAQLDKPEEDPFHLYEDLKEMLHDYTVLGQISGLLATLKRSYTGHGLREELIHEVLRDLQRMIQIKDEQLRLVNSCSIVLEDTSRSEKPHYVLQTQTAAIKQDWCVDFMMAKLAIDKSNRPAWDGLRDSDDIDFDVIPAHFMKHLPVDVPRNYTKTRCAVPVFLGSDSSTTGFGIQHLWVCSSTATHGQVSVLSVHNSKPGLVESFKACGCDIMCAESVPGCGETTEAEKYLFAQDTVWVTNAHSEILIFPLTSGDGGVRRDPLSVIRTPAVVMAVKFVDERVFCGFDDGALAVYSRTSDGSWNISEPVSLSFGSTPVKIHFVHEEDLWLSCATKLCVVEIDSIKTKAINVLNSVHDAAIDNVVKSGVGIWVSFHDTAYIKLFHIESMESLQEISVGNFVNRIRTEKLWSLGKATENLVVTSLAASKGLLWIGTSVGVILTVPLPRLSDGVPLYRGRPSISLHAHRGPVKFLLPMQCSSSVLELNRASSLRSTIKSRQSRRNLERQRMEFNEIETPEERDISSLGSSSDQTIAEQKNMDTNAEGDNLVSNVVEARKSEEPGEGINGTSSVMNDGNKTASNAVNQNVLDKNESQTSYDDSCVQLRRKSNLNTDANHKSKTLSFRSELAQRIEQMVSSSEVNLANVDKEPHEVEMLYEVLLEDDPGMGSEGAAQNANNAANSDKARNRLSSDNATKASSPTSNSQSSVPSWLSSQAKSALGHLKPGSRKSGHSALPVSPVSPSFSSASSSSAGSHPEISASDTLTRSSHQSSPVRSLQRIGTTKLTTSRKISSNAVIVVSGGDGYCDLDLSRNQSKADDASILLWIYKF